MAVKGSATYQRLKKEKDDEEKRKQQDKSSSKSLSLNMYAALPSGYAGTKWNTGATYKPYSSVPKAYRQTYQQYLQEKQSSEKRYNTQQEALQTGANVKDMEWYAREKAANRLLEYKDYSDYLTAEVARQKGGEADEKTADAALRASYDWAKKSDDLLMQMAQEAVSTGYSSSRTLDTKKLTLDQLAQEAAAIKTELYRNRGILGDNRVQEIEKGIDSYLKAYTDVRSGTKQKSEIMSQFADEDEYNRAVKDEEYRNMSHEERLNEADRLETKAYGEDYKKQKLAEIEEAMAEYEAAEGVADADEQRRLLNKVETLRDELENGGADRLRLLDEQILDEQESDYWDSLSAKEMQEQQKYFLSEIERYMTAYENEEIPANQRYYLDEIQRMRGWYDNLYRREQIKEQQENFEALSPTVQNALIEKAYAERVFGDDFQRIIERYDSVYGPDAKNYGDNDITKEKIDTFKKAQFDLNASDLSDEEIEEQMKYARRIANERYTQRRNEIISENATKNFGQGAAASLLSVPANLIGGVAGLLASIGQYLENSSTGRYQEIDTNSKAFDLSNYSDTVRSSITERLGGSDSVLGFLYGTGMSMADSAVKLPFSGSASALMRVLPTAVLGMSSATSMIKDTVERGGTTEQALVNGIFAGAAEMLCEKYSLESLFSLGNESNIKAVLKNAAKQTFTEGSEEAATDLVNFMADQIVMGDLSEYNLTKQAYIMQGMTEEDAAKRATADFCKEMFVDFAGGALSGGVMGGLTSGIHYAKSDIRNAAKLADYEGQVREEYNESYKPNGNVSYEEFVQQEAKNRLNKEIANDVIQKIEKQGNRKNKALGKVSKEDNGMRLAREVADQQMREADTKQSFPSDKVRFSEVGNDAVFKDTDGKTIYEDEIPYKDENEKAVYEAAKELDNVRAANAMINTYAKNNIKNLNGKNFSEFYKEFYNAGKKYDSYDALPEIGYKAVENAMGEIAARSAFISGQNVANQRFFTPEAEAKVLKSGGVLMNTSNPVLDDNTNFMLQVVDAAGKKYNRVFEVRDDSGDSNGFYRPSDNRIILSLNSQDNGITRVAGHELFHFIKQNNPKAAQRIQSLVITRLKANPNYDYEGRVAWLRKNNPGADPDEDITAESMFDVLNNKKEVRRLLSEENPSFFEKVKDWIDNFIGFLDDTIKNLKNRKYAGAEIRALQKDKKTLKEIRDLFYQALEETKSVGNTREIVTSEQKFSIKDIENYSETEYNQYGWAVVNDVLSRTEYRKLNEQFAAIAHGETFERTRDGYYVIPVGEDDRPQNAFVFIKGTISKPVIGQIMIIDVKNEMELDRIRRSFNGRTVDESSQIAGNYYESVNTYSTGDFESYRALQRQASEMRRGVRGVQGLQKRSGFRRDSQGEVRDRGNAGSGLDEKGRGGAEETGRRERGGNRYSIKEAEEQVSEKALLRENEHLKKMVASLKEQMKLTKGVQVKQADIEKLAGRFLREYRSSTDKTAIVNGLKSMFEYIGNDPERNGETAFLMAKNISRDIIENSRLLAPALNEDYAEVRDYLKNTAVYFPQNVRSDIFYNDFRKEMFGRVKIRDTGVPVDAYFNELKGMFPEFGRYDVQSDVQAAEAIADIASRVWTKTTPDGTDVDTMALSLASDIFDAYFDIPQFRSFADKQKAKLDSLKREYRDGKRKLRADLREKYEGRIGKVKEAYRTRERERIQKEEHDSLVRGIARSVNNLSKRFLYPTDKQNIPVAYRKWVGEVLSNIDVSKIRLDSSSKKNAELQEMMKHIGNMANWRNINLTDNQDSTIDESLEIDPDAKKIRENVRLQIDQLYEQNGNRPIDLSAVDNETLKQINNIMQSTLHSVVNYNKVISANKKMTISQMGEKTIADNNTKRGNAFTHALKKIFQIDAASLETYLYGLGDVGTDIWKMFRQGETDKVNCIRSAQSFVESVYADMPNDFRKSLNSKELITYEFKNGSVSFTKQQLMELYALSRRAQAMQHIENGGIITGDIPKAVAVTREELNKLFDKHLTDVEKDFSVRLQRYLSTEVAKWGNSVTRREFGYDKFTEEFYWPISVDKDTVKTTDKNASEDNVSMWAIRNTGMTKAVNEKATNAIYIHNLMDTFSNHVVEMATYNGYSLVIRDVMGWFNYNGRNGSVKGAIRNAYGSDKTSKKNEPSKGSPGAEYFLKFMKDLNGGQGFDNTTAGNMVDRMASKAKVASVGANLRVIVQQPTAIVRAFDVVEAKYFFPNGKAQKQAESEKMHLSAYEEAARYSTAAQLKACGFRENGISTQFSKVLQDNATLKEKVTDVALWGAEKADAVTWGRIWNACKRKIAAENPSIDTKSEEFFQMSGKLMDDVCYQTQVFDTLLCRTQNMRSKHSIVRILTAFTAEPAKSYNMLLRAFMSGSKKEIGKVIFLTTLSSVLATAAGSFVSAGRDDDDYKTFWEKYLEAFGGDILDSVNPLSSIPFMSELLNRVMGSDYDTPEFYEQAVENTQSLLDYIYKCFSGETDFDFIKFLDKLSKSVSTLTGIPFSNVLREARTIWNNMPFVERDHKSRTSDYYVTKDSALYDDLLSAMEKGDQDAIDRVKDELIARGKSQKQLNSGLKSVLKEKYEDEVTDAAEARQEGNTSRYEQLVNALSKKTGMNVTLVAQSVESVRKKTYEGDEDDEESDIGKGGEKKTRFYSMADANRALESNNLSSAQRIINQEYAYKVDEYLAKGEKQKDAEEKARSSIKSSITNEWKGRFLAAGLTERSKIRSKLHAITVGGKKIYTNDDMARWIKSNK